jgi:hypothetical protein
VLTTLSFLMSLLPNRQRSSTLDSEIEERRMELVMARGIGHIIAAGHELHMIGGDRVVT